MEILLRARERLETKEVTMLHRGLVIQNLSDYRRNLLVGLDDGLKVSRYDISFHIERYLRFRRDGRPKQPYNYSTMINVYFPRSGRGAGPTVRQFRRAAELLPGFVEDDEYHSWDEQPQYKNEERNMVTNWCLVDFNTERRRSIRVGVVQRRPVKDLKEVLQEVVPYVVNISNRLSPRRKINDDTMGEAVKLARRANLERAKTLQEYKELMKEN